jgi:hypothetical protein
MFQRSSSDVSGLLAECLSSTVGYFATVSLAWRSGGAVGLVDSHKLDQVSRITKRPEGL